MRRKLPLIKIPENGPPDVYALREMQAFDKLPASVRKRLDSAKAGEIIPAQYLIDVCGTDEGHCHRFLDKTEKLHRERFG